MLLLQAVQRKQKYIKMILSGKFNRKYIIKKNISQKMILLNLKLAILFTPLILFKYVDCFRANQQAWLKLFVLFGITSCALKYLSVEKFSWKNNELSLPIFVFILIMTFSLFISHLFTTSFTDYLIFLSYFILYFLVINNIENENIFYSFIRLFFITSSLVALYTILHYYGFIPYLKEFGPVISTIGQKNWTSNYSALIFPLMFSYFLLEKLKRKKIFYFVFLSIIYATLMICQSRGIWISISITSILAIYIIFKFRLIKIFKENKKWLIVLLSVFLIITIIYSTDNPLNKSPLTVTQRALSTFDEKDTSINTRFLMWKNGLQMIKDRPFLGGGLGSFRLNYLDYQAKYLQDNSSYIKYWTSAGEAHNEYLQIGAEMGLICLGIFILIIFIFYKLVLNFLKSEKNNQKRIIGWGLIGGITCFLIHCLFTFPLHVPALGSAFFIILGLTVVYIKDFNLSESGKKERKKDCLANGEKIKSNNSRLTILFTILILLIALLLIDTIVIRPYLSEVYAYKGKDNFVENNYQKALSNFEYAAQLDPYNGRILLNLGTTYYNLGIYDEAEKALNRSKKYYNDRNIYRNLALCYMQLEKYKEAEEEFKYAIYLCPKFTKAYVDLAYLYAKQEDYNKAIVEWNKILEIDPDFSEKYNVLYFMGLAYQKKQMPDKALEYFLEALQLAPEGSPTIEEIEEEIYNIYISNLSK